jgi:glycosyltransferase involved in cell wall biosynthesis
MHIGLLIYGSLSTVSGGYLYDRMLIDHLAKRGHDLQIVSLPWRNYPAHLADNVSSRLWRRLSRAPFDLLLQDELNHPSLFWLNRRLRQQVDYPIVSIVHHLRSDESHSPAWRLLYHSIEKAYLNTVHGFIFNSAATARSVKEHVPDLPPYCIAFPAGDHVVPPAPKDIASGLAMRVAAGGPIHLIAVGTVIRRKNLHTVLKALAQVPQEQWYLTIIGSLNVDTDYVQSLQRLIAAERISHNVSFTGKLSDEELRRHLALADLFILPSFEGFGIVYLEALAFGLPVVAAVGGAPSELITNGVNGYLVDATSSDAIRTIVLALYSERWRLQNLGVAARQRFDAHPTWAESMDTVQQWLSKQFDRRSGAYHAS